MLRRVMGKLAFITLRDGSGDVQLYMDRSIMNEQDAEAFRCASMSLMVFWVLMGSCKLGGSFRWHASQRLSTRGYVRLTQVRYLVNGSSAHHLRGSGLLHVECTVIVSHLALYWGLHAKPGSVCSQSTVLLPHSNMKQTVDVGDFVGVRGGVKKTDRGEVSVVSCTSTTAPGPACRCGVCSSRSALAVSTPGEQAGSPAGLFWHAASLQRHVSATYEHFSPVVRL